MGANSFLYEVAPIYMGDNNVNDRVASPKSEPIHLNVCIEREVNIQNRLDTKWMK